MRNFLVLESNYGPFVINRNDRLQAPSLLLSGRPHIQSELDKILGLVARLPPDAIAVDAGANAGLVAVPIAQLLAPKGGRVLAFEVQRMMYYALCGTVALNGLDNLFAYHLGLGDSLREQEITPPDYGVLQDFGTFSLLEGREAAHSDTVSIVTIDSLELPRLDFLKIDVEGMDIEVLKGGARTIKAHRPWCWVEYWKVGAPEIKMSFAAEGYEFFVMDDLNLLCAPRERIAAAGIEIDAPRV